MTTNCRKCQLPIEIAKNGQKTCPNGCDQWTAQPIGTEYINKGGLVTGTDGRSWETGGTSIRCMPTNKE